MSSPTTPASIGPGEFFPVVGVGPHEKPWPEGDQYDPELLLNGDRRNVLDHYRYWTVEAIVADLNKETPSEIASSPVKDDPPFANALSNIKMAAKVNKPCS